MLRSAAEGLMTWVGLIAMKAARLRWTPGWAEVAFMDIAFRTLAREAYKKNAAVYACVRVHANAFPEAPLRVWSPKPGGGRVMVENHPLVDLMQNPNPFMGEVLFWQFVTTWRAIGGNCYLWKERSGSAGGGRVVALWPLHDGQMSPVVDPVGWISHYQFDPGDGQIQDVPLTDVVHLPWAPDPECPQKGMSPIVACARTVDHDNEATRYVFALLKNDAVPRTIIKSKAALSDASRKVLKNTFREQYGGDQRGDVALIEGADVEITRMGANLQELAVEALHNIPETRISAAFEVPAVLANLNVGLMRAINANAKELREQFTEQSLVPQWRMVAGQMTSQLLPDFRTGRASDRLFCAFDTSDVSAMQEDENKRWERVGVAYEKGVIKQNEARGELGFPAVPDGDTFKAAPAPFGAVPTPAMPTAPKPAPPAKPAEPEDDDEPATMPMVPPKPKAVEVAESKAAHQYATVQVDLPDNVAGIMRTFQTEMIPDDHLAEDGREDRPHVTIKYGLVGDDGLDRVRAVLADAAPIRMRLGRTGCFPGLEYDVLTVSVDSLDLHRLNRAIAAAVDHVDTFPVYVPHATLAYLKPGLGAQYADNDVLDGEGVEVGSVVFSDPDGVRTTIHLAGGKGLERKATDPAAVQRTQEAIDNLAGLILPNAIDRLGLYFRGLAERVAERAGVEKAETGKETKAGEYGFGADDLLPQIERMRLVPVVEDIGRATGRDLWGPMNDMLGVQLAFDLEDPAIQKMLAEAGERVTMIDGTTRQALREALSVGSEHGLSTYQLVNGDAASGFDGLRKLLSGMAEWRAERIARTEMMQAAGRAQIARYGAAGDLVLAVQMVDGTEHEPCASRNGRVVSLAEYERQLGLEHPMGTLTAIPIVDERDLPADFRRAA